MNRETESESFGQTGRLLAELDRVLDESSALRDIMRRYEQLRELESITGPTPRARGLREELDLLQRQLRDERGRQRKDYCLQAGMTSIASQNLGATADSAELDFENR
jgi:hypothetical protein